MTLELSSNPLTSSTGEPLPSVDNSPGLAVLTYRMGTHTRFKAAMREALACGEAGLQSLAHAETDDPTLALVDAWATTLDVLTFYQERIANEGYLRTAIERRSVQELSRAVGYELNPGVAAETQLAFTLEDGPGAPEKVAIDGGVKVQSVPGPGEQAQIFETVEKIEARPEWNVLKPQMSQLRWPQKGDTEIYLKGVNTGLKPGDGLLFVGQERRRKVDNENWDFRQVKTVEPDAANSRTRVTWDENLGSTHPPVNPAKEPEIYMFRLRAALFGHNAPDWIAMPLSIKAAYQDKLEDELKNDKSLIEENWPQFKLSAIDSTPNTIHLDATYPQIRPGSWLVLAQPDYVELYEVEAVVEAAQVNFTLSSKTTCVTLKGENLDFFDHRLRETVVFAQSEKLEMSETPIADNFIEGITTIPLDKPVIGLESGRNLIITGTEEDSQIGCSEQHQLANVADNGYTLRLKESLRHTFVRDSMTIYANVARATHGETRQEVLGSANAAQSFQQFALRQGPLTFTPAATPSGGQKTLQVRVNDILWNEKPSLYGSGSSERIFSTREGPEGKGVIQFGDGVTGARPPSGDENVSVAYRVGLGTAGNVKTGQLRVLLSRPLGVRGVNNLQPATGGTDREDVVEARQNTPYTALTLGRIVTLRDYEDFARAFGGVGKARADWLWDRSHGLIFVTVVGADGNKLAEGSYQRLIAAIDEARDLALPYQIETVAARRFSIHARLVLDPRYRPEPVLEKAKAVLRQALNLKQRDFGQAVTESEILGMLQSVEGVKAADLEEPYPGSANEWKNNHRLDASLARSTSIEIEPAELLILDENLAAISLEVVTDLSEPEKGE